MKENWWKVEPENDRGNEESITREGKRSNPCSLQYFTQQRSVPLLPPIHTLLQVRGRVRWKWSTVYIIVLLRGRCSIKVFRINVSVIICIFPLYNLSVCMCVYLCACMCVFYVCAFVCGWACRHMCVCLCVCVYRCLCLSGYSMCAFQPCYCIGMCALTAQWVCVS